MVNELEIYNLTKEWIVETGKDSFENFSQNPLAMKYDNIRNQLVNYFGYKINECLDDAIETFEKIEKPSK